MTDKVWIVINTLRPDEMEVFDNELAAISHRHNCTRKWQLTKMFEKEVKSL